MTTKEQLINEWEVQQFKYPVLYHWTLKFNNRLKRVLGRCKVYNIHRLDIELSTRFMAVNSFEVMRNVLLHEIAHALHWEQYNCMNHNECWKRICREIGCNYKRVNLVVNDWAD